jgi:hypothetical protein
MAKPANLDLNARTVALALQDVARTARAQTLDALDTLALGEAAKAADALNDWRKDTSEASRRRAAAYAGGVSALCMAGVPGWRNPPRKALALLALAIATTCEAAPGASRRVHASARAAVQAVSAKSRRAPAYA